MNDVIAFLKKYIWENGFAQLSKNPFGVYEAMMEGNGGRQGITPGTARLVLVTLMSKTHEMAKKGCSAEELTRYIQAEHFVNKKTAKELAAMYLELFSDENKRSWNEAEEAGFEEFCKEEWDFEWTGRSSWHAKRGGSYPCFAEASLTFTVQDKEQLHDHLFPELKDNPFLSKDDIYQILEKQMGTCLDKDLYAYCSADDYYEPYLDDFVGEGTYRSEKEWKSWGLEIDEFTGSGDIDFDI